MFFILIIVSARYRSGGSNYSAIKVVHLCYFYYFSYPLLTTQSIHYSVFFFLFYLEPIDQITSMFFF